MLEELTKLAEKQLNGITRSIPELVDVDSTDATHSTAQTIIQNILLQAKKGNVQALSEMLSGTSTDENASVVKDMHPVLSSQLQNKLNISEESAGKLMTMALPIILNMLNTHVQKANINGFNVDNALQNISNQTGIVNSILGLFGGKNQNVRRINTIFKDILQ